MKRLTLALFVALAACANAYEGKSLSEIKTECNVAERPFVEAWKCVREGFATQNSDDHPDVKQVYLATGDYVADQVSAGTMTESEARLSMATAEQRAHDAVIGRRNAAAAASAPVDAMVLGRLMNRQPPAQSSTQFPRTVVCNRVGNTVYCN